LDILDDFSHYTWNFPLRHKSDACSVLVDFFAYVQTQFQRPILALQTDKDEEFENALFRHFHSDTM
jgi:hypothetical protein